MKLTSSAFENGQPIPRRHTCEGEDRSPPLEWSGAPAEARSLVLIVVDLDGVGGPLAHWVAWGIDPASSPLAESERPPVEGRNDLGTLGYRGPCPPPAHRPHRYAFRLRALDCDLDVAEGAERSEVRKALDGHVLAEAELIGTYER